MADVVQIQGSDYQGKLRSPLAVVGLMLITLGIYFFFWYYKINKELAAIGRARGTESCGTSPGTSLLAVTLGAFVIIPPFVSIYQTWERKRNAARLVGAEEGLDAGLGFLISILIGLIGAYLIQSDTNKILQAQAGAASAVPAQARAVPAPQPAQPERPS